MLKHLSIENLILIEKIEVNFDKGFHVFSGETGSGKSVVLHALRLLIGEKTDATLVRHEASKGSVEAIFDLSYCEEAIFLLNASGFTIDESKEMLIRREISAQGKSKAWINHQNAQLSLLKQLGTVLVQIVEQNGSSLLLSSHEHRHLLDLHGNIFPYLDAFKKEWELLQKFAGELETLKTTEAARLRAIEVGKMELSEIEDADVKEEEEELLFSEYSLLFHAQERKKLSSEILNGLQDEGSALIPKLNRLIPLGDKLQSFDSLSAKFAASLRSSLLELQELSYDLQAYVSHIDTDAEKLSFIDSRLSLINRLKKKYGGTTTAILAYAAKTNEMLRELENADYAIEQLEKNIVHQKNIVDEKAKLVSEKRLHAAKLLENLVEQELAELNMPHAKLNIDLTSQPRNKWGDDTIEFFLQSNIGEKKASLCDGASGGERARVLLALHVILAGKSKIPTLIFDEIDANIGGLTAAIIGKKLLHIAKNHQVICITHFPQVAEHAEHHISVTKQLAKGRTFSSVEKLTLKKRASELDRMRGKK